MRFVLFLPNHDEIRSTYQQSLEPTIQLFDTSIHELQVKIQNIQDQLSKTS